MPGSPGGKNVGRLSLKVLPDTSEFLDELKVFAERVEKEVRIELPVSLDIESASQELKELQARMEAADLRVDIATELDAAGALAHLDVVLAAMQGTADLNPINIDVDVDGQAAAAATEAVTRGAAQGSAAASRLGGQIALWGPLIFIAAAGIAALAPALLVLFPLVAGLGLGLGALITGASELRDAFKPVSDAFAGIKADIVDVLTSGLKPLISSLATGFIPVLRDGLVMGAQFMNTLIKSLLEFLNSSDGLALMAELFKGLGPALEPLAQAMGPLVELFVRLSIAALPGLEMMSKAILGVVEDLNKFLAGKDISDTISTSMSQLGDVLVILGKLAADLFVPLVASAPAVIGFLTGVADTFGAIFDVMTPLFNFMSQHTGTMALLGAVLTTLVIGFGLVAGAAAVFNAVMALNPIALVVIAIAGLVAGLIYAYQHFEGFRNLVDTVFAFVKNVVSAVVAFVTEHWRAFATALLTIFTGPIGLLVGLVASNFGAIRSTISSIINAVSSFLRGAWDKIKSIFTGALSILKSVVSGGMSAVRSTISGAVSAILGVVKGVSAIGTFFSDAFGKAKSAVTGAITKIKTELTGLAGKAVGWVGDMGGTLKAAGVKLIQGFINGIGSMFDKVKGKLGDLTSKLTSWKGPESLDKVILYGAGQYVIGGFVNGLEDSYPLVESSLTRFTDGLKDMATFDGEAALRFSGSSGLLPQLDGVMTVKDDGSAVRMIIDNWDTGVGRMTTIAADAVAGYEASTESRTPPQEETP